MRKSLFFILLATASMPALAAGPNDRGGGDRHGGARAERSDNGNSDKSERPQRAAQSERADQNGGQRAERAQRAPRVEPTQQIVQSSGRSSNGNNGRNYGSRNQSGNGGQPVAVVNRDGRNTNWQSRQRYSGGRGTAPTATQQGRSRYDGRDRSGTNWGDRTRDGRSTTTTTTTRNWRDGNRDDHTRRWTSNWRNDNRYDWRNHRSHNSSLYHLGRYYDPFGYGYRRFSIGLFLGAGYYGNNYWLNDPYQYRLPPAYGPYRWVRYYNDALLVDTYTGEVVDVLYGFFW
jgi:Ni/Co efflux regulator RcnB